MLADDSYGSSHPAPSAKSQYAVIRYRKSGRMFIIFGMLCKHLPNKMPFTKRLSDLGELRHYASSATWLSTELPLQLMDLLKSEEMLKNSPLGLAALRPGDQLITIDAEPDGRFSFTHFELLDPYIDFIEVDDMGYMM